MSLLVVFDLLGTIAFAFSGAIVGVRKQMDVYGVFLLAIITAMGGGTIRDIIIGKTPVTVLMTPWQLIIAVCATLATFLARVALDKQLQSLLILDAIGIGMFTISGVTSGIEVGVPIYGSLMLGVVTSTAGGIMRDLLGGEIPLVLRRDIYASASLLGGLLYWLMIVTLQLDDFTSAIACTAVVTTVRLLSIRYGWHLPYPHKRQPRKTDKQ